jgi:hypothetical protein
VRHSQATLSPLLMAGRVPRPYSPGTLSRYNLLLIPWSSLVSQTPLVSYPCKFHECFVLCANQTRNPATEPLRPS